MCNLRIFLSENSSNSLIWLWQVLTFKVSISAQILVHSDSYGVFRSCKNQNFIWSKMVGSLCQLIVHSLKCLYLCFPAALRIAYNTEWSWELAPGGISVSLCVKAPSLLGPSYCSGSFFVTSFMNTVLSRGQSFILAGFCITAVKKLRRLKSPVKNTCRCRYKFVAYRQALLGGKVWDLNLTHVEHRNRYVALVFFNYQTDKKSSYMEMLLIWKSTLTSAGRTFHIG